MIFSFRRKKAEVLSHWFTVIDAMAFSTDEFYREVERELADRKVPDLTMTRVEFQEGGPLSDRRVYLRMIRERLVFDVCAAPFGRAYFFSLRFAEIPSAIRAWQVAVCLLALVMVTGAVGEGFAALGLSTGWGLGLAGLLMVGILLFLRNAVAFHLLNLDAALIRSPVVGPIYERFLRKETYYRHDTRMLYHTVVSEVVRTKVEEVTGAKGVRLLRTHEHSPILDGLYKTVTVPLPR